MKLSAALLIVVDSNKWLRKITSKSSWTWLVLTRQHWLTLELVRAALHLQEKFRNRGHLSFPGRFRMLVSANRIVGVNGFLPTGLMHGGLLLRDEGARAFDGTPDDSLWQFGVETVAGSR